MRKLSNVMSTALVLLVLMACGAPTHIDVMTTPAAPDSTLQMALDDAEVKSGKREDGTIDAGVAYSEPGFDQALANCLNGMRVWPSEGAATVSRAINSEYAEVIAQCTAVRYGSDGAPEESRWMLIRTAVSSMPESELGWVPLECCAEYTEENSHQAVFPLKLSADYGQGESWFVRVDGTDADGNVLVSAPGGWSAAVQQGDVVYPPVGGERLS